MRSIQAHDLPKLNVKQTWDRLMDMGLIVDEKSHLGPFEGINGAWQGEPAYVIGTSPGLRGVDFSMFRGKHTIGINHLIEDWDGMEWFLFLDRRFLEKTTYDIAKFSGRVFASNKAGYFGGTVFKCNNKAVSMRIEDGLYRGSLSGLAATNLALIAGADPIYLVGLDSGGVTYQYGHSTHYKDNYTGDVGYSISHMKKYSLVHHQWKAFLPYANRIINLDPKGSLPYFRKMPISRVEEKRVWPGCSICHVQTLPADRMGTITQALNSLSGQHTWDYVHNVVPKSADIYLLHCFTKHNRKFVDWSKPKGSRVVSIVHSDKDCFPAACSDAVVFLTRTHRMKYDMVPDTLAHIIPGGIDLSFYSPGEKDYSKAVVGRCCRSVKLHPEYLTFLRSLDVETMVITPEGEETNGIPHDSFVICDRERRKMLMSRLTLMVWANNDFQDVFPMEVLEAMALGIPVVALWQASPAELMGDGAIICNTWEEVKDRAKELIGSVSLRKEWGRRARIRAQAFPLERMLSSYNKLLESLC